MKMSREKEIRDIAEKLFIRRAYTLQPRNDRTDENNKAIVRNLFELAELFVIVKEEREKNEKQ